MRHTIGNVLRNVSVVLVHLSEAIDPQPDILTHPFSITTANGTTTCEARITWHETC